MTTLIGGFLNLKELVMCILYAFFVAGIFSFVKLLFYGNLRSGLQDGISYLFDIANGEQKPYQTKDKKQHSICFSIPILIGLLGSQY